MKLGRYTIENGKLVIDLAELDDLRNPEPSPPRIRITEADAKAEIKSFHPYMQRKLGDWDAGAMYEGAYGVHSLLNALRATGDLEYWEMFKDLFAILKGNATQVYEPVKSGQFYNGANAASIKYRAVESDSTSATLENVPPDVFKNDMCVLLYDEQGNFDWSVSLKSVGGPKITWEKTREISSAPRFVAVRNVYSGPYVDFGADHNQYFNFKPHRNAEGRPNIKEQWQWAASALHLFYLVISRKTAVQGVREIHWTHEAYDWIRTNIVEFLTCERNDGWRGGCWIKAAESARDKKQDKGLGQAGAGYWGSNVGVGLSLFLLDDEMRKLLGRTPYRYMNTLFGGSFNPSDWIRWWLDSLHIAADGSALWDTVDTPSENRNINFTHGWGYSGEHKAPGTHHAGRYPQAMQVALDTGVLTDTSKMQALGNTLAQRIFLPRDYAWQTGPHTGQISGTVWTANYIDGFNGPFRAPEGWGDSDEGNVYMGWNYPAEHNHEAFEKMADLLDEVRGPAIPPGDVKFTGTYKRHSHPLGRSALVAGVLAAQKVWLG